MSRKVIEIIKETRDISYSFEVTPNITDEILINLDFEPLFYSITWHAHLYKFDSLDIPPLRLANILIKKRKNILLHLSCTNMKKDYLNSLLAWLQEKGICNIFIILGENFKPNESDFKSSQELVLYIRHRTGSYFCIGVAGFPDRVDKMWHLKQKVESGANFIITQAFFEYDIYEQFVNKCNQMDINVPIIPGIFPFENKRELEVFVKVCDVHLPKSTTLFSPESGYKIVSKLIHKIKGSGLENHFHLFTLNKIERSCKTIKTVTLLSNQENIRIE